MARAWTVAATAMAAILVGCGGGSVEAPADEAAAPATVAQRPPDPTVGGRIEVTARDYKFELPDPLRSGWNRFEFENRGREPHFFVLWLLPEGKTIQDYFSGIATAYGVGWNALLEGASQEDAGALIAESLPDWLPRAMGGIGTVSPGETARTTLELLPGDYVLECYVRTVEGKFHSELGMARALTATAERTTAEPPAADLEIALSNGRIELSGEPASGSQVVAVHIEEHPSAGLGNDVHLVRLDEATDLDAVARWMNWMNPEGMQTPAPARFLGGAQEMDVGATAYFEVDLEPGRYAWVMEQPDARDSLVEFEVAGSAD